MALSKIRYICSLLSLVLRYCKCCEAYLGLCKKLVSRSWWPVARPWVRFPRRFPLTSKLRNCLTVCNSIFVIAVSVSDTADQIWVLLPSFLSIIVNGYLNRSRIPPELAHISGWKTKSLHVSWHMHGRSSRNHDMIRNIFVVFCCINVCCSFENGFEIALKCYVLLWFGSVKLDFCHFLC